jgi:oligopeptidase A
MPNPLLDTSALPRFRELAPEQALPAVRELIAEHRRNLADLLGDPTISEFDALVTPLEEMSHRLSRVWSPVSHLQSVLGNTGWRDAFNDCLPLVTEYATEMGQNEALHDAFRRIAASLPADTPPARRALVEHALRDFRLAGIGLPEDRKNEFREIRQELAAAQARFDQNVQDATDAWHLLVSDRGRLAGLPAPILARAAKDAAEHEQDGWRLPLDMPTYQAVMTHADDRALRQAFYRAWTTRASDQANDPAWDNAATIERIMSLRHRMAQVVGFRNFAEYSLATKMAATPDEVTGFLRELAARTRPAAEAELASLVRLAGQPLEPWDLLYYLEKLKQDKYSVSDEILRQYFPADRAKNGIFGLAGRLYGVTISRRDDVETWHDSVRYFEIHDGDGNLVGGFYTDLYARPGKRGGAWMDECIVRKNLDGKIIAPVGYLVCNFSPPNDAGVSLLTHNDVLTLFHEFGHMLHHLLTRVDYPSIAGINGVPWDAVELPSQFMENFAWQYEVIRESSAHHETGEPLPEALFDRLQASRYCGAAMSMLRQIEFALYDFTMHAAFDPAVGARTLDLLRAIRDEVSLVRHPDYNRFPMSFTHIFSGGYAAGYYSYKWAEVLAADAFLAFEEAGLFDPATAQRFRQEILEIGGSRDVMEAFVAFRGRKPKLDALLKYSGIGEAA